MAFDGVLGDLEREESLTTNKILDNLLNPENINMKTHITQPVVFSILEAIIDNIESLLSEIDEQPLELPMLKKVLNTVKDRLKEFMVSWNRLSRDEVTKTLQSIRNEEQTSRTFAEKLLGMGRT